MDEELNKRERQDLNRADKVRREEVEERGRAVRSVIVWGAIILVILGLVFLPVVFSNVSKVEVVVPSLGRISEADHVRGSRDSTVILVEYGDYQCPACATIEPLVDRIVQEFGDRIAFIFRHLPLRSIHDNALEAAQAAEAAGVQGRYWDMHRLLYEHQKEWSSLGRPYAVFEGYAEQLNLDMEKFRRDYESAEVEAKIVADERSTVKAEINSTPTFLLSGERVEFVGYDDFTGKIRNALGE